MNITNEYGQDYLSDIEDEKGGRKRRKRLNPDEKKPRSPMQELYITISSVYGVTEAPKIFKQIKEDLLKSSNPEKLIMEHLEKFKEMKKPAKKTSKPKPKAKPKAKSKAKVSFTPQRRVEPEIPDKPLKTLKPKPFVKIKHREGISPFIGSRKVSLFRQKELQKKKDGVSDSLELNMLSQIDWLKNYYNKLKGEENDKLLKVISDAIEKGDLNPKQLKQLNDVIKPFIDNVIKDTKDIKEEIDETNEKISEIKDNQELSKEEQKTEIKKLKDDVNISSQEQANKTNIKLAKLAKNVEQIQQSISPQTTSPLQPIPSSNISSVFLPTQNPDGTLGDAEIVQQVDQQQSLLEEFDLTPLDEEEKELEEEALNIEKKKKQIEEEYEEKTKKFKKKNFKDLTLDETLKETNLEKFDVLSKLKSFNPPSVFYEGEKFRIKNNTQRNKIAEFLKKDNLFKSIYVSYAQEIVKKMQKDIEDYYNYKEYAKAIDILKNPDKAEEYNDIVEIRMRELFSIDPDLQEEYKQNKMRFLNDMVFKEINRELSNKNLDETKEFFIKKLKEVKETSPEAPAEEVFSSYYDEDAIKGKEYEEKFNLLSNHFEIDREATKQEAKELAEDVLAQNPDLSLEELERMMIKSSDTLLEEEDKPEKEGSGIKDGIPSREVYNERNRRNERALIDRIKQIRLNKAKSYYNPVYVKQFINPQRVGGHCGGVLFDDQSVMRERMRQIKLKQAIRHDNEYNSPQQQKSHEHHLEEYLRRNGLSPNQARKLKEATMRVIKQKKGGGLYGGSFTETMSDILNTALQLAPTVLPLVL